MRLNFIIFTVFIERQNRETREVSIHRKERIERKIDAIKLKHHLFL
ncbi:hypothetical protein Q7A53_18385 [Halobacillus rhizosphaerae]